MSGIIVGIDGSSHSHLALEWGMREAVARRVPLTVIAVEQAAALRTGRCPAEPGSANGSGQNGARACGAGSAPVWAATCCAYG